MRKRTMTKKTMNGVREYLSNKYGEIPQQWEVMLSLLEDNIELYQQCKKSVDENGIFNKEDFKKNPLLSTMKDLQATIIKQIQHLGLSPYAESKIRQTGEDDTDDFIEALTQ